MLDPRRPFILLYFLALFIFLAHFLIVGKGVYGDARYYYSYLPTVLIHHSLNFSRAYTHFGIIESHTPHHLLANKYSIGSALVWTLPFLVTHVILFPFHLNDGYNNIYQLVIGIGNISLVFIGLYFLYKTIYTFQTSTPPPPFSTRYNIPSRKGHSTVSSTLKNESSGSDRIRWHRAPGWVKKGIDRDKSLLPIIFLFLGTNLLFYGAVDVINSHSASFFAAAMVLYFWLQKKSMRHSLALGFFIGLLALIRLQDSIFIILPLSTLVREKRNYIPYFLLTIITTIITFIPQLIIWQLLWGKWYQSPYLGHEYFNFFTPHIFGVLFNMSSGLFLWTPLIILCVVGLNLFAKKHINIGVPLLIVFLLQLYIIASWSTWWQGASYSGRMFVSDLPLLGIGLAYMLQQNTGKKIILRLCLLFCLLNPISIIYFLRIIR